LDKHFNQQSEELRKALDGLLGMIERERARVPNLLKIKDSDFYSNFTSKLDSLAEQLSSQSDSYCASLDSIKEQIEKRKDDIFTPLALIHLNNSGMNQISSLLRLVPIN
jgi:archaellum component FlaC